VHRTLGFYLSDLAPKAPFRQANRLTRSVDTMSKPIARVAFVVLISLVLIAATSASVRGWLGGTSEAAGIQSHAVNGLQTNFNHYRSSVSELESRQLQSDTQSSDQPKGHGCESESAVSPDD